MWRVASLVSLGHVLAYSGDTAGARTAATAAVDGSADFGEFSQGFAYAALAVATLAAGDVAASASAGETAWKLMKVQPELAVVNVIPLAQVALAHGDLTVARRWADDAVLGGPRARISRWRSRHAHGLRSPRTIRARPNRTTTTRLPGQPNSRAVGSLLTCSECLAVVSSWDRLLTQKPPASSAAAQAFRDRVGSVRFTIYDEDHDASVAALREAMGDNAFEEAWAAGAALSADEAIAYAQRGRGERKRPSTGWAALTPAEINVVRLVSEGLPNKDVAARLFVSTRTVQAHLSNVYNKLGLRSRVQLAQEATRHA